MSPRIEDKNEYKRALFGIAVFVFIGCLIVVLACILDGRVMRITEWLTVVIVTATVIEFACIGLYVLVNRNNEMGDDGEKVGTD